MPRKTIDILMGESLINDAAALTFFGIAVTAATRGHRFIENPVAVLCYSIVVGTVVGLASGLLASWARRRVVDPTIATTLNLIVPFVVYLLAEKMESSDVFAVVAAGFVVSMSTAFADRAGHSGHLAAVRLQECETWPVVDTLLESFVFAYIGLQCRFVLVDARTANYSRGTVMGVALVVLVVVMVTRFVYMFLLYGRMILRSRAVERGRSLREGRSTTEQSRLPESGGGESVDSASSASAGVTWKSVFLGSWAGMRGILTLAAAAGIPLTTASGEAFPERDSIQRIAFVVVLGTVLIQGVTLPWVVRRLHFDGTAEDERANAMEKASVHVVERVRASGAVPDGDPALFDLSRQAIIEELRARRIDDQTATTAIRRIDLAQAAAAENEDQSIAVA